MRTATCWVMLSKFKVKSVDGGNFLTHFRHNRAQNYAPAQIQPSLTEVYEAEIRRLREENHYLRIHHNSITTQLNEVVAQLQQSKREFDSRSLCYSFLFLRGSFKIRNSWPSETIDTELHCFAALCCALLSTDPKSYKIIQHFQVSRLGLITIITNLNRSVLFAFVLCSRPRAEYSLWRFLIANHDMVFINFQSTGKHTEAHFLLWVPLC